VSGPSAPTTLFLVRHGRATAGAEVLDPGLDAVGRSQAEHAARALARSGAVRVVSSPLRRARETAAPIGRALDLDVEIRDELAEVFPPEMATSTRVEMLGPFLSGRWSEQAAPLLRFREGVLRTLIELADRPTVVVSHFVAISVAIGETTQDDRVAPCALAHASITTFALERGRLALRRSGEVAHLPRDEISSTHLRPPPSRPA